MNTAILLAGGVGSRMGYSIPKQFIEVLGKPIIAYTLDILEKNENIDAVEIVCVASHIETVKDIVSKYNYQKVKWIVEGGKTFTLSVYNGLKELQNDLKDTDFVMIHMSVAPFINDEIINDSFKVAMEYGNAISENPCLLCMGTKDNSSYSTQSVDRDQITGLNTPQTFNYKELLDSYNLVISQGMLDELEPHTTAVYYYLNKKLYFSKGSQMNIKITNKDDLELFEAFCIMKEMKGKTKDVDLHN